MRFVNKKFKIVLIIMLVLVEISSLYLVYKSFSGKNNELDEVKLKGNNASNDMFVIMIEQDGEYVESEDSVWPEDKIYNEEMSGCMDVNGKKLEGILTYDDIINRAYVKVNKEVYCYLYFDSMIEDVEFAYTGGYQEYTAGNTGYYYIEAYGAQGGAAYTLTGGKGGYTSGIVYLKAGEKLYIYVGGQGEDGVATKYTTTAGGYNGGGSGYVESAAYYVAGGGGATDIRYFGSTEPSTDELVWNSELGLNSRIMVAAGGGGVSYNNSSYNTTVIGHGGGLVGSDATGVATSGTCYASAGTQVGVGANGNLGAFGIGATGTTASKAGGGGGYYGGNTSCYSGGGGSSFISGYAGVNAITSSSDRTHTNNTLHYSGKYFIDGKMRASVNSGDGKAKISFYGTSAPKRVNEGLNNVRYIKNCMNENTVNSYNILVEFQAIYNGSNVAKGLTTTLYSSGTSIAQNSSHPYSYITDGDITTSNYSYGTTYSGEQCFVVDLGQSYNLDEVSVWGYWGDGRLNYENITYTSNDNETWTEVITERKFEDSIGNRINAYKLLIKSYSYTGAEESITLENSGCYQFELWGARGGNAGGAGGYTTGTKSLEAGTELFINIGGSGKSTGSVSSGTATGGYNGGGKAIIDYTKAVTCGSGGGATHIATASGLLSSLSDNKSSVIAVAGAGGGDCYLSSHYAGGAGGGYVGNAGNTTDGDYTCKAYGGAQTPTASNKCSAGNTYFGLGKNTHKQTSSTTYTYGAGGGGGYYGGGGNWGQSDVPGTGAGGSGYIGGMNTDGSSYMYCLSCTTSSDNATLTYSTSGASSHVVSEYAKYSNGAARIYYLGRTCS